MRPLVRVLLALWVLAGCQSLAQRQQATALEDTLRSYEAAFRWGAAQQLNGYRAAQGSQPAPFPKDLRIVHYEVVQGPTRVAGDRAVQTVRIEYLREADQVVRELLDHQVWVYRPGQMQWQLHSPLPHFE